MKKFFLFILISMCNLSASANAAVDTIPQGAKKLISCYKDFISGYSNSHIILKDGTKLLWDDGIKNKSWQSILDHPDLKDMFSQKKYREGGVKNTTRQKLRSRQDQERAFLFKTLRRYRK